MITAEEIVRLLKLQQHPKEEGFFVETYRAAHPLVVRETRKQRSLSTAIYFLLTTGRFSEIHRLKSDEIFHFYLGAPAEMLLLHAGKGGEVRRFGNRLESGEQPQIIVSANTWQGMKTTGDFTLFGCTVSPGFDYEDYESGDRRTLINAFPDFSELIKQLTHS